MSVGARQHRAEGPNEVTEPCELLPWDSEHFGLTIARVRGDGLGLESAREIDEWCAARGVDCLYLLAASEDEETSRVAAEHGYRVVDVRLTLRHGLEGLGETPWQSPGQIAVRQGTEDDLGALRPIAADSHRSTRFYFDGGFPEERCGRLYERWLERAVADPRYELLVPEREGRPIGYQVIRLPGAGPGRLDLLAIDAAHRRNGFGRLQLLASLRRVAGLRAGPIICRVQARNADNLRVHERVGFEAERVEIWHHKWYGGTDAR